MIFKSEWAFKRAVAELADKLDVMDEGEVDKYLGVNKMYQPYLTDNINLRVQQQDRSKVNPRLCQLTIFIET